MMVPSGLCEEVSDNLLSSPVSGLMGLAWQALSSSGSTPFWENLYQNNVLDEPLMAFYLTRFQNSSRGDEQEPGGVFTLGWLSYYTTDSLSLSCIHDRQYQHLALYRSDRLSIYSFGLYFVLDPPHHQPDCEFGLGITTFGLVLIRRYRHGNYAHWGPCRSSRSPVCADSRFCHRYWQLPGVLYLPYVPYLSSSCWRTKYNNQFFPPLKSLLDDRQPLILLWRPNVACFADRLSDGAKLEQPVHRRCLYVFCGEWCARVDHRRHLSQERLLRLPREPGFRRLCHARRGRAELSHEGRRADGDDRFRERERHRLGTFKSECRVTCWRSPTLCVFVMPRHEHLSFLPPLKERES